MGESDAESQKRKRQNGDQRNPIRSTRRKLSIEDDPDAIRVIEGRTLSELPVRLENRVVSSTQQLGETSYAKGRAVDNVQILLETIGACKLK